MRHFQLRFWLLGVFVFFTTFSFAEQAHLEVTIKKGEGVMSILKKYDLFQSECNRLSFYQLNDLKQNEGLKLGVKYKLPIFVYTFDGQSIRSTLGIKEFEEALKIQHYNDAMTKAKIKKGNFRSDKELWVPYHLLFCPDANDALGEAVSGDRIFPIFGKEHQHVPLKSSRLKGKVYYISSGHGGPDPGAMGRAGGKRICEDEYAYDVALRLARNLLEHGAMVYMIIRDENDGIRSGAFLEADKDEVCWKNRAIPISQKSRLHQRSTVINALYDYNKQKGYKEQYVLMLHIDSRGNDKRIDVFFYHKEGSEAGKNLALHLQKVMKEKYGIYQKGRGYFGEVKTRDLHMLRETKPTAVFVELGNIRSDADLQRFLKENNRQAVANWLFEGLNSFKP